jgi:hypothetical protein
MRARNFLIVTVLLEGGIGLLLLARPPIPLMLLLGVEHAAPEALAIARITGAALLAIGVVCWQGLRDRARPERNGLLLGILTYDVMAASILAYSGWFMNLVGIALWPAVGLHAALSGWCVVCLWNNGGDGDVAKGGRSSHVSH